MKRVYGKKGRYVLGSAMLLLMLLLTGCVNSENKEEEIPESISSIEQQEPLVIQNTEATEDEQVTEDNLPEQAPTISEEELVIQNTEATGDEQVTEDNLPEQAPTISEEDSPATKPKIQKEENAVSTEKPIQENSIPAKETETKKQANTEYTTSISGNVESVGKGSFVISQINTSKASDGSDLAIKSDEGSALITVSYADTTEFVMCSSSDGGKTSSETTASSQDLTNGKQIMLEGAWNQNDFIASKVIIYNFN